MTAEKQTFLRVVPKRWRRKPVGIDTERNHVTVTVCKRQWVTYVLGQQRWSASACGRGNTVGLTSIFHWKISHFNYRAPSAGASGGGGLAPYRKIALPLGDCTGRPITGPSYAWVVHGLGWPVGWVGSSFWWVGLGPLYQKYMYMYYKTESTVLLMHLKDGYIRFHCSEQQNLVQNFSLVLGWVSQLTG